MGGEGQTSGRVEGLPVDAARAAAEAAGIPSGFGDLSVFQALLHHPRLASALHGLLSMLLWEGKLDGRLRELAIMRIGWTTGSVYEWAQHWRVATAMGIPDTDLLGVRDPTSYAGFDELDRAVLSATDEVVSEGAIRAGTWDVLARRLSTEELLELVVAIGNWSLFSTLLRSLDVPLEDGVEPWPPDGIAPEAAG